jgi:sulfur carrier protein
MTGALPHGGTVGVRVNGDVVTMPVGCTVADVLGRLGCGTRGVAVAVNSELVRRADWPVSALGDGDELEVLQAVPGG